MPALVPITPQTRSAEQVGVSLVKDGIAQTRIVVMPGASQLLKDVAADLQRILHRMSGATLPIVTAKADTVTGIFLQVWPSEEDAPESLRINHGFEGREAFAISMAPGRVTVMGATDLGTSNGVYRMLRELGCRWLTPHPAWEVVPAALTVRWSMEIVDRPQIVSRSIWFKTSFDWERASAKSAWGSTFAQDTLAWRRRNMHHDPMTINAGHAYGSIIRAMAARIVGHPEYGPLMGGVRHDLLERPEQYQLELGNPEVRALVVDYARQYFKLRPTATMVSLDPNDGGAWSESPEFKALGSVSDAVFGMANEVARMLQAEFPGKMVGLYAYREHGAIPSFPLEDNVHVQVTAILGNNGMTVEEARLAWQEHHRNLGVYDYYSPYYWHFDQPGQSNAASIGYLAKSIRASCDGSIASISAESSGGFVLFAPGYYVANQLMWDARLDELELLRDFHESAFGPAAPAMARFYDRWNPEKRPIISRNLIHQMVEDVADAIELAQGDGTVLARLEHYQHHLRYLQLDWYLKSLPAATPYAEREAAFTALMRHMFRIRYTYATHWALASQGLWQSRAEMCGVVSVRNGAKVTNNQQLLSSNLEAPWRDSAPITAEEVQDAWASTRAYFASTALLDVHYSSDMVAVEWPTPHPPLALTAAQPTSLQVQNSAIRLILESKRGEDMLVEVRCNVANQKTAPRDWVVRDMLGEVVSRGQVGPTTPISFVPVTLPVKGAGLYEFEIQDNGGYTAVTVPDTSGPATMRLPEGGLVYQQVPYQQRFFYVPKGTKHVQYLYDFIGAKHKLIGPTGAVVYEGLANAREYHTAPVPAGMDGKLWRFDAPGLVALWFTNIPPYLAASPSRLLVPREVALADGLRIINK